jgi:hypothetical protein
MTARGQVVMLKFNFSESCDLEKSVRNLNVHAALRCSTLLYAALRCSTLLYAALLYSALRLSTLLYAALRCSALRCSTLVYAALRCSTLLYAARRCSTLLDATLRCSTLLDVYLLICIRKRYFWPTRCIYNACNGAAVSPLQYEVCLCLGLKSCQSSIFSPLSSCSCCSWFGPISEVIC